MSLNKCSHNYIECRRSVEFSFSSDRSSTRHQEESSSMDDEMSISFDLKIRNVIHRWKPPRRMEICLSAFSGLVVKTMPRFVKGVCSLSHKIFSAMRNYDFPFPCKRSIDISMRDFEHHTSKKKLLCSLLCDGDITERRQNPN